MKFLDEYEDYEECEDLRATVLPESKKQLTINEIRMNDFKKTLFKAVKCTKLENLEEEWLEEEFWISEITCIEDILSDFKTKEGKSINDYLNSCIASNKIKEELFETPAEIVLKVIESFNYGE